MVTALFPGSFDPITNGHIDIIKQASELFDNVIVAVADNINKKTWLTVEERTSLITSAISNIPNVIVDSYTGLTVEYAQIKHANVIIRGLRNSVDFEYEKDLAYNNRVINENIKTIFLIANNKYSFISSSAVRELHHHNASVKEYLPENVYKYLINK